MAAKQPPKPIAPFYRAVFRIDKTAMGYKDANEEWGQATGFVMARHRWKVKHTPYCVPNEYICAKIGSALGLPIPPFAITTAADSNVKVMFTSLDFNPGAVRLPPVDPQTCVEKLHSLCVGVVVFDIWIANEDRHDENLAVDKLGNPKSMRVFDHDQALFGGCNEIGIPRLVKLRDRLGITGSNVTGGNPHCLAPFFQSDLYFETWVDRVQSIPEWIIVEACRAMMRVALTKQEVDAAIDFLLYRRKIIHELVFRKLCEHCGITATPREVQRSLFVEK